MSVHVDAIRGFGSHEQMYECQSKIESIFELTIFVMRQQTNMRGLKPTLTKHEFANLSMETLAALAILKSVVLQSEGSMQ